MHPFFTKHVFAASLLLMLTVAGAVWAEPAAKDDERAEQAKLRRERLLVEMRGMADAIRVTDAKSKQAVPRLKKPLFRYNSPTREHQDGTIWAWGGPGRPLVVMELFSVNTERTDWIHGCALTSDRLVEAQRMGRRIWYPQQIGAQTRPIPSAAAPSRNETLRLRQMKQLSRRFRAHEFWGRNNNRFDMRLMVNPVHRYRDPEQGLVDGAMFLMAHEIEPEVIIMIEAVRQDDDLAWQYAVTPIGSAEFHIFLDGDEIYRRDRSPMRTGYPSDPWHSFHFDAVRE